ncbi:hypothetical protein KAX03_02685 [Candidatus Bathyarchaeota archaeon]|nr:hypothetical protein [Candidatus Bathyarchaeota archaeon]
MPLGGCLGHLSRNEAIAKEVKKRIPTVKMIFAAGGLTYEAAKKWKLEAVEIPEDASQKLLSQWFDTAGEESKSSASRIFFSLSLSFFLNNILRWLKLWRLKRDFKPDLIIADGEYPMLAFCKAYSIPCVFVTNDLIPTVPNLIGENRAKKIQRALDRAITHLLKWAKLIIVPDIPGTTRIPAELDINFTGPVLKINLEDVPDKKIIRRKMKIKTDDKIILVNVSGTGAGSELIYAAIDAFKKVKLQLPKTRMIIKYWPAISDEEASKHTGSGLELTRFVPDLFEYIVASDVLVTHTGHTTLMEAALAKTPIITTPYRGQIEQLINAKRMEASGRVVVIYPDELTSDKLASSITLLLKNKKKCLEMVSANERYVDGKGASRATDLIIKLLKN